MSSITDRSIEPVRKMVGCCDACQLTLTDESYSEPIRSNEPMRWRLLVERMQEGRERRYRIRTNVDSGEWSNSLYAALASFYGAASFSNYAGDYNSRWVRETGLPELIDNRFDYLDQLNRFFDDLDLSQDDVDVDAEMRAERAAGC